MTCLFYSVYHLPDLPGEVFELKWLLEEPVAGPVQNLLGLALDAVTGGQKSPNLRIDLPEAIESISLDIPGMIMSRMTRSILKNILTQEDSLH